MLQNLSVLNFFFKWIDKVINIFLFVWFSDLLLKKLMKIIIIERKYEFKDGNRLLIKYFQY